MRGITMTDIFCTKVKTATSWALLPSHQTDEDALKKLPLNQPLKVKVTKMRNVGFHRKYFALMNYAFDCWEPPHDDSTVYLYNLVPEKNFDRFRRDITVLSGFYDLAFTVAGEPEYIPRSISFAKMEQDEFEILYDKTIDVIINHVMNNHTGDELRAVVEQIEEFG